MAISRKRQALPVATAPTTIGGRSPVMFLIGGFLVTALFFGGAWKLYVFGVTSATQVPLVLPVLPSDDTVRPTPAFGHERLPALPTAAAIAAQRPAAAALEGDVAGLLADTAVVAQLRAAKQLIAASPALPLSETPLNALALAWCEQQFARDRAPPAVTGESAIRAAPTAYPTFAGWDLIRHSPGLGSPAAIEGRSEAVPADAGSENWQRHLLIDDHGGRVLIVSDRAIPAAELTGRRLVALGRFLGVQALPGSGTTAAVDLPVIAAISLVATPVQDPLGAALAGFTPGQPLPPEHPLWEEIDDQRLVIEKAPYYALLAQVGHDRAPSEDAKLPSLNWLAADVRRNPAGHRGAIFTLFGTVVRTWEDPEVATDRPLGVTRAARMLLYHEDIAPVILDHDRDSLGRPKSGVYLIPRLYDVAVPGDAALPTPGEVVRVSGRFLKFHARPFNRDSSGKFTAVENSQLAYSPFVVAASYTVDHTPGRQRLPMLSYGTMVVVLVFAFFMLRYSRREWLQWRALKAQLRASAESRKAKLNG